MKINDFCPEPTWIGTEEEARMLMSRIDRHQSEGVRPALDTETTGLDKVSDHVVFWSVCYEYGSRYCIPAKLLGVFKPLFNDPRRQWWFTNAKFDMHMLYNSDAQIRGVPYCTLPADWLLDDTKEGLYGLKETTYRHFGIRMMEFDEVFGLKGRSKKSYNLAEILEASIRHPGTEDFYKAVDYASGDAWHTFRLGNFLEERLREAGDWHFMKEFYAPMIEVLWGMEHRGVMLDMENMDALRIPLTKKKNDLEVEFYSLCGREVKMGSGPELAQLFFIELGVPIKYWTDGGKTGNKKPSLTKLYLKELEDSGLIHAKILRGWRETRDQIKKYIDNLKKFKDGSDRIHATFNLHRTATGRLSASEPPLQQIPIRSKLGPKFRACFRSAPGKVFCAADYSQLEQAIMAHYCQDPNMLATVREGKDIHSGSTAIMYPDCTYEEIVKAKKTDWDKRTERQHELVKRRSTCKNLGFGLNYGMGINKLSDTLGVSWQEAKNMKAQYLSRFPKMRDWIDEQHRDVRETLVSETLLGRKRHLWGALAGGGHLAEAERRRVNTSIQGGAADIVALAMLRCHADQRLKDLDARLLLQIHDELIFEVPEENAEEAAPIIQELMEYDDPRLGLTVPMRAEPGIGKNWNEAKA